MTVIKLTDYNHPYRYAAERIVRSFGFTPSENEIQEFIQISAKADTKLESCTLLYDSLSRFTNRELPWGVFTGVHPIRFIRENREKIHDFRIREDKLALADEIISMQNLCKLPEKHFHLYIGIPFCPSRCKYCSFVSESVAKSRKLISQYVDFLIKELQLLAQYADKNALNLDAVYIGGGTPTALPVGQQLRIYDAVQNSFNAGKVREYTIEAGRPETLSAEVLNAIKQSGCGRITINPQSMNNNTLNAIGRGHSTEEITEAYKRARELLDPDAVINMDLISGLPGESESDFVAGLYEVIRLEPDNITVHSLAVKRASEYAKSANPSRLDYTESAYNILKQSGYSPYYLYRQSGSAGDNIGYARSREKICLYNVYMMDESSTVLAAGCGGATRLISSTGTVKKRYNFKYPYEYISRFDSRFDEIFRDAIK